MGTVSANGTTRLFISYSHADNAIAERLATDLRQRTFSVWMDRSNIEASQVWSSEIEQAIRGCEFFLVLLSPHSIDSSWVRREIFYAQQWQKVIVPILIAPTTIPIQISDLQYADCTHDYQRGLQTLLLALGVSASTATPLPAHAAASEPAPLASNTVVAEGIASDITADTRARANSALSAASTRRRSIKPRLRASRSVLIVTCVALLVGSSLAFILHNRPPQTTLQTTQQTTPGYVTFSSFATGSDTTTLHQRESAPSCDVKSPFWTVNDPSGQTCLANGAGTRLAVLPPQTNNYLLLVYLPVPPATDQYTKVDVSDISQHFCGKVSVLARFANGYSYFVQICSDGSWKTRAYIPSDATTEVDKTGRLPSQGTYTLEITITGRSVVFSVNHIAVTSLVLKADPPQDGTLTLETVKAD